MVSVVLALILWVGLAERMIGMRSMVVLGPVLIALGGCAAMQLHEAHDAEQVLSAAGFHMKLSDTPEKLANLRTLPPRKLVPTQRNGQLYYVYADPDVCKCLYIGTEAQYQQFQRLALEKRLAAEQLMAAQNNLSAVMDWGLWDPWPY